MIYRWMEGENVDMEKVGRETETLYEDYYGRAVNFYKEFFTPLPTG
jgi:hypothetical protein